MRVQVWINPVDRPVSTIGDQQCPHSLPPTCLKNLTSAPASASPLERLRAWSTIKSFRRGAASASIFTGRRPPFKNGWNDSSGCKRHGSQATPPTNDAVGLQAETADGRGTWPAYAQPSKLGLAEVFARQARKIMKAFYNFFNFRAVPQQQLRLMRLSDRAECRCPEKCVHGEHSASRGQPSSCGASYPFPRLGRTQAGISATTGPLAPIAWNR